MKKYFLLPLVALALVAGCNNFPKDSYAKDAMGRSKHTMGTCQVVGEGNRHGQSSDRGGERRA